MEGANLASFPATGETGKIYVALDTNLTYRWSGTVYTRIATGDVASVNAKTGVVVLTTIDIADSTNKRYVTDANLTTIGNQSGTNTGDNAVNSNYASDYRSSNFVAGTNYIAPTGSGASLTGITSSQVGAYTTAQVDTIANNKVDKVAGSRLITTPESTILGNTSGTNTGDNATNTSYELNPIIITTNTTLTATNNVYISNGTSLTHTLPNPVTYPNKQWTITNINATVALFTGTIQGDSNIYLKQNESLTFFSDGTNLYTK